MSKNIAFRVDSKHVNTSQKELIDSTITRLGRYGNIIERRKIETKNERMSVNYEELTERSWKRDHI